MFLGDGVSNLNQDLAFDHVNFDHVSLSLSIFYSLSEGIKKSQKQNRRKLID